MTRNAERETPKRLYMVGAAVAKLLSADEREALKVTSVGVKAFERQESKVNTSACMSSRLLDDLQKATSKPKYGCITIKMCNARRASVCVQFLLQHSSVKPC